MPEDSRLQSHIEPPLFLNNLLAALQCDKESLPEILASRSGAVRVPDPEGIYMNLEGQAEAHEFYLEQGGYDTDTGVPETDYVAFSYYNELDPRFVRINKCPEPWRSVLYDSIERYSIIPVLGVTSALEISKFSGFEEKLKGDLPQWALAVEALTESPGFDLLPSEPEAHFRSFAELCRQLAESHQRYWDLRRAYQGLCIWAPDNAQANVILGVGESANGIDPIEQVFDEENDRLQNEYGYTSRFVWRIEHQFGVSSFTQTLEMLNEFHANLAALYEILQLIRLEGTKVCE